MSIRPRITAGQASSGKAPSGKARALALTLFALAGLPNPAQAQLFEAPLECTRPRIAFLRGICADAALLAQARQTEASLLALRSRLAKHPTLREAAEAYNQSFALDFSVQFDQERFQPTLALRRHKAVLDAIEPRQPGTLRGAWANASIDLTVTGGSAQTVRMRSQGFGHIGYDCRFEDRLHRVKAGWRSGSTGTEAFHIALAQKGAVLEVATPQQSERAPDDCPPWAGFSGTFVPVNSEIEHLPAWVLPQRDSATEKPFSLNEMLSILPGAPLPEHAPELTREIVLALAAGQKVEGWTTTRPKPETLVISRDGTTDLVAFQFPETDRRMLEVVARHKARWHLAEWYLRADNRTLAFSVPSLRAALARLFLSDRGGLLDGLPRERTDLKPPDDLKSLLDRLQSCQYFGVTHKAGPVLPQGEIDRNRAASRCEDLERDVTELRTRRSALPDALRLIDLARQLADD